DGEVSGVKVSIASHASVMGRQFGELAHVYSHVVVDVLGLVTPFRLTKEGAGSKIVRAAGLSNEAEVGDETFDSAWNVGAEAEPLDEQPKSADSDKARA